MIDDVIITEVEGFLQNDNLPFYNAIKAILNTDTYLQIGKADVVSLDDKTFDVYNEPNDTLIADNVSSYSVGTSTVTIRANSNGTNLLIKGKYYDLLRFSFVDSGSAVANRVPFDIGQLAYSEKLTYVKLPNRTVDIEGELDISLLPSIVRFQCEVLNPSKVSLLIPEGTELPDLEYFSYFRRFNTADAGLTVNIIRFAPSKKLANLLLANNSGVEGSLNDLLNALKTNGKVSGELTVELTETSCTYNNNPITGILKFRFGSDMQNPTEEESERGWQQY